LCFTQGIPSYALRRPHIEADPVRNEDANVPEPAASKSGRRGARPARRRLRSRATAQAPTAFDCAGRYELGAARAGAVVAALWSSGGGTSKAEVSRLARQPATR
jgi:hypothetical protein